MAAVTKNRNVFNCPLLLYYKSKWAQIFTAATWKWLDIRGFSVKFFFQPIYSDYAYVDKRSHLNLFLWNCWTKLNQTWQGWSLSKLCPTATPSIQDGCCYSLFGDSENRENNSQKINGLSDLFFNYIYIKDWLIHITGEFFKTIH